jgi:hypothetical protein
MIVKRVNEAGMIIPTNWLVWTRWTANRFLKSQWLASHNQTVRRRTEIAKRTVSIGG